MAAGLKSIIALSLVLALGFLLLILSCALWGNWLPLISGFLFVFAPFPNVLGRRGAGADDFSGDYASGPLDLTRFLTSTLLVSAAALPPVLAHAGVLAPVASVMAVAGGALVYGTMVAFGDAFRGAEETF